MELGLDESGPVTKILKIIVVGDIATGKTAIIRRYVDGMFSGVYLPTIGVDFAGKEIQWTDKVTIGLRLWDIGGGDRHQPVVRAYYQDAVAAIVVFDVTNSRSLDIAAAVKHDVDDKVSVTTGHIPCLLVGNKIDLCEDEKWGRTPEDMKIFIEEHGFTDFYEVSAQTGENVEKAVHAIVRRVLDEAIEPVTGVAGVNIRDIPEAGNRCC